tara:strand:- start:229 stop:411 length:183 start_codon:yes stop_codon:yes gene_type:complete
MLKQLLKRLNSVIFLSHIPTVIGGGGCGSVIFLPHIPTVMGVGVAEMQQLKINFTLGVEK